MKRKLVFASTNRGKFEEVRTIAAEFPKLEVLFPADLGIGVLPDVEEVEDSYEGNARLKAKSCFQWCQIDSFADDAGIEVETLNGRPGVRSARYAGDHATSEENLSKLLSELKNSDNRAAKFVSVIVAFDGKSFIQARGELKGKI
ncbi:MAG: non-canonical purine NTP pyrophosphatase, partial [Bdellovibrionales bacterium]|nr:non-canonical purine NTP pyrophosphatase [Bdellovibrionales bacterium]